MISFTCDRCGTTTDVNYRANRRPPDWSTLRIETPDWSTFRIETRSLLLCIDCTKSLAEWISG